MNEKHINSEFFSDDPPASTKPLAGKVDRSMKKTVTGVAASGPSRVVDFAVARAIAGFELSMLVLTGRNISLVQRNPDQ